MRLKARMWAFADGFALEDIGLQVPGERSTEVLEIQYPLQTE